MRRPNLGRRILDRLEQQWQRSDIVQRRAMCRRLLWPAVQFGFALAGLLWILQFQNHNQHSPIRSLIVGWYAPIYFPALNLILILCVVTLIYRAWTAIVATRRLSCLPSQGAIERSLTQSPPEQPARDLLPDRLGWVDFASLCSLTLLSWGVLEAFRQKENPTGACVGSDYITFLSNIVAAGMERWDLYNPSKRLPYSVSSAWLAQATDLSYLEAGQFVSFACVALLPAVAYLAAAPVFGRLTAWLAALVLLSMPIIHPFAIYTGSYALFFLVIAGATAAAVWAAVTRRTSLYVLTGLIAALSIQTQSKGLIVVLPVAILLTLLTFRKSGDTHVERASAPHAARERDRPIARAPRNTARARRMGPLQWAIQLAALWTPLLAMKLIATQLPVDYPSLGSMVVINRQEVHRDMPFEWPEVITPNQMAPSPISSWLPESMRGGELEQLASVVLAPPNSKVVLVHRAKDQTRQWLVPEVFEDTTIPPLFMRVSGNLRVLSDRFPGVWWVLLALTSVGVAALLIPLPRGIPPSRRAPGVILLVTVAALWGPLSLNFHTRYLIPILPAASVLIVHGTQVLIQQWLGEGLPILRWTRRVLVVWFIGCLCLSLFTRSERVWIKPSLQPSTLPGYLGVANLESHTHRSEAVTRVADWVREKLPPRARVYDCTPLAVWLMYPEDPRFAAQFNSTGERDQLCQAIAHNPPPSAARDNYVIVSDTKEFRGPDTITVADLLQQASRWELAFGIVPETGRTLQRLDEHPLPTDAILVFRGI